MRGTSTLALTVVHSFAGAWTDCTSMCRFCISSEAREDHGDPRRRPEERLRRGRVVEMTRARAWLTIVAAAIVLLAVGGTTGALASAALTVRITSAPPSTSASASATFGWVANETAQFTCSLDGAQAGACSSPKTYSGLGEGLHTFPRHGDEQRSCREHLHGPGHAPLDDRPARRTTTSAAAVEDGESPRHRRGRRRGLQRAGGHQLSGRLRAVVPGRDEGDPEPEARAGIAVCRLARCL